LCQILIFLISIRLFAEEEKGAEKANKKTYAESVLEKTILDNTQEVEKKYEQYLSALEEANQKIVRILEDNLKDLKDAKKTLNLDVLERAEAIKEFEVKIAEVKAGSVGEAVVTKVIGLKDPQKIKQTILKPGKYYAFTQKWNGNVEILKDGKTVVGKDGVSGRIISLPDEGLCILYSNGWNTYGIVWDKKRKMFIGENRDPNSSFKEEICYVKP